MYVLNNTQYYTQSEVAQLVGKTRLTILNWHKLSEQAESNGRPRFIPKPLVMPNGYKVWSADQVEEIKKFSSTVEYASLKEHPKKGGNNKNVAK